MGVLQQDFPIQTEFFEIIKYLTLMRCIKLNKNRHIMRKWLKYVTKLIDTSMSSRIFRMIKLFFTKMGLYELEQQQKNRLFSKTDGRSLSPTIDYLKCTVRI